MLPAVNRGVGKNICFPDVCLTNAGVAVVPVPYPNMAPHAMALGFSPNVMLSGLPALKLDSMIAMTSGDEGGTAHPMIKQMGRFTAGNPVVHVNLLPGINLACPTTGNNMNAALGAVLVTGLSNVLYTCAPPAPGRELCPEALDALRAETASAGRRDGPPVSSSVSEDGIGIIEIAVFSADVPARLAACLERFDASGVRACVIDLRGNPGGELSSFVGAAGLFLPRGSAVARVRDADGDVTLHRSSEERPCRLPLVVLVDGRTASAAELFAECLSAHGRAEIVGGPTYGKRSGYIVCVSPDCTARRVLAVEVEIGAEETLVPCGEVPCAER